jgi:hypothetical protein
LPGVGQPEGPRKPREEADTVVVLDQLDLLADGSGRNRQLLRGLAEAEMAGGRFNGAKAVERRQAARHVST